MSLVRGISKTLGSLFSEGPFQLIFYATSICNAKCEFCYYSAELNKSATLELTLDEVKRTFKCIGTIPYLALTGGEPFIRKDLYEVLDFISANNKPHIVAIPTNCSFPDRIIETYEKLCERYPDTQFDLHISLDAWGEGHDEIRKIPGLFQKVLETNRRAAELLGKLPNFNIKVISVYSGFNKDYFDELVDRVDQELVFSRFLPTWPHGTCSPETFQGISKEKFAEYCKKAAEMNSRRGKQTITTKFAVVVKNTKEQLMREHWNKEENLGNFCNAGRKILVLGETGKVFPCETLWYEMGNVRDYGYDFSRLVRETYPAFHEKYIKPGCHCEWGCAQNVALVTNPSLWPHLLKG